jgi:hypothetical protein
VELIGGGGCRFLKIFFENFLGFEKFSNTPGENDARGHTDKKL